MALERNSPSITFLHLYSSLHLYSHPCWHLSKYHRCQVVLIRLTISVRPKDEAKCNAMVPDPGGWMPFGEIALCDSNRVTVSIVTI